MTETTDFAARLKRLEDRDEIRTLVARYGRVVDDRDMESLRAMFTPDALFGSQDGAWKTEGREAVIALYEDRFSAMPISNHFTHDHVIWFERDDRAHGHVNAHAEMIRDGVPFVVALRYEDTYVPHDGAWKFQERAMGFFYYMRTDEYLTRLKDRQRMRGDNNPRNADWPEGVATWQAYEVTPSA